MERKQINRLLVTMIAGMLWNSANAAPETSIENGDAASKYNEMVLIPAGKFIYGKDGAKQEINLSSYMIDKYEVTNDQYAKINADHHHDYEPGEGDLPAGWVSQIDAGEYCETLGKRLPTEQEWEKAARGTDGRIYPWGNEFDESAAVTSETASGPAVVGSRPKGASPFGVMDMSGNVWEWTDSYSDRYVILRGGSYFEDGSYAKVTSALRSIPDDSKKYVGFRCVKSTK